MTVNHGGRLQPEYFRFYLSLVMSSRDCHIDCARDYMLEAFFHGSPDRFGPSTYESFLAAVQALSKGNKTT
jgi:hypothetical protein